MIDQAQLSQIVRDTLKEFKVYDTSMEMLIKGTFLIESDLTYTFDHDSPENKFYGFMMLSNRRFSYLLDEFIRYRRSSFNRVTACAVTDLSLKAKVMEESCWNIRLMVILTYEFYSSKFKGIPENNIEDVAKYYVEYYSDSDITVNEFMKHYNSVFSR